MLDRHRHARRRPAGHRRAFLHVSRDDRLRARRGRQAHASASSCSTGRIRSTASISRVRCRMPRPSDSIGYVPMPIRHGLTLGELARLFNGEKSDRRGPHGRADEELAPRRLVRRHRPGVGQPVAEHAEHGGGDRLSGHWRDRRDERFGRARHRHAVRAARGAVDRRPCAGGRAQRAAICPAFASIRSRSRRRPARSSAARRATASS